MRFASEFSPSKDAFYLSERARIVGTIALPEAYLAATDGTELDVAHPGDELPSVFEAPKFFDGNLFSFSE